MKVRLSKTFRFEAAHLLPEVPEGHKCRRLHGHSYRVEVVVEGPVDPRTGWLMDYAEMGEAFAPIHARLDHYYLNEVDGLQNPTSENIARWIWDRLAPRLPLVELRINETCTSACIYRGER